MGQKSEDEVARDRLGAAIRQLRAERKLSRRELERATGLSYPYLSEIEAGKKSPSTRTLRAIADALGLEAHELLETAETGDPGTWTAPRRSHFHESPATFGLTAESASPLSPRDQQSRLTPATGGAAAASSAQPRRKVYLTRDFAFAELAGQQLGEDSLRLLQLVRELSPDDLKMLIQLATRLQK